MNTAVGRSQDIGELWSAAWAGMGGAGGLAGVSGEAGRDGGRQFLERPSANVDACAPADEGCSQERGASEGAPHLSLRTKSLRSSASPAWLRRSPNS